MSSGPDFFEGCITDVIVPENSDIALEDAVNGDEEEHEGQDEKSPATLRIKQRQTLFFGS